MTASGRGVHYKKQTVEKSLELSVFTRDRHGNVGPLGGAWTLSWIGPTGESIASVGMTSVYPSIGRPKLRLRYTLSGGRTDEKIPVDYTVPLTATPCHFGGERDWFLCPGAGCGRRVAKLHHPPGATYFLCRYCHGLTYEGRQRHRGRAYEVFGKYGLYRRRLEMAHGPRQRLRWSLRLLDAEERIKTYKSTYQLRFLERLNRLKRRSSLTS